MMATQSSSREHPVPPNQQDAALKLTGLYAGYRGRDVLHGLDLEVSSGEVVAVLGPNGAGKTTLLNTVAGILTARRGTVAVHGSAMKPGNADRASRAGIVLVPDDRALFSSLSVEENLRATRGCSAESLEAAFERFPGLRPRRKVRAGNLSGGEQQMLALARALAQSPEILMIDEMSMGLAPVIVADLMPLVRDVAETTGAAVILVEQHVSLALEVADRALVLGHGEVLLDRPAAELRAQPEVLESAYLGATS